MNLVLIKSYRLQMVKFAEMFKTRAFLSEKTFKIRSTKQHTNQIALGPLWSQKCGGHENSEVTDQKQDLSIFHQ
ncbi:hypothetical protein L596_020668 [Steinernema carpocapsae]|uniref:Uncharacterized protein n=1 Tax=Steinernema carpocapsae TaxID=34508 RepID=A0A4U5MU84_STECR|nr:hypothetical protein L596_020668 [Steinernema carpocapsae]